MFLLKKVFQIRDGANPDHEKPFLEHLEDLRVMITRIVVTLLIAMIACFSFQEQLMDILRLPVERVWQNHLANQLPGESQGAIRPVDVETWEKAKEIERAAAALLDDDRAAFLAAVDPDLRFHAETAAVYRAALVLPEEDLETFLKSLADRPQHVGQVRALLGMESRPSAEIDTRGNLKLMSALKPTETFMLSMKLSFFAGIVISFPLLLLYILQFVLPGLHTHERGVLWPALSIGFGLFLGGVAFAYFFVLPRALGFFFEWSGSLGVSNDWRIGEYITFATQFTLLFGLAFELPVVVMVIVKLGLLTYETMIRTRRYAIVAIFVLAAVLTPTPDIFTLSLMAAPMILLYEICIWLAWLINRKEKRQEEEEARERMERLLRYEEEHAAYLETHPDPDHHDPHHDGDDGWHDDHHPPQHDPHADIHPSDPSDPSDPPEIPEDSPISPPPDSTPEAEERRRMDS
jgi:sec-independent protein translocase protein TatC